MRWTLFTTVWLCMIHCNKASYLDHDSTSCKKLFIVETIPDDLKFNGSHIQTPSTTNALLQLLHITNSSLDIAEYYFNIRAKIPPGDGSDEDGHKIYDGLHDVGLALKYSGGGIRILQNKPNKEFPDTDSLELAKDGAAIVRFLDFEQLIGGGIIHTKLWISDKKHFYLGSANMDWQSLRQVKELGVLGIDCPILAEDLYKLFEVYWYLTDHPIPDQFPAYMDTRYNLTNHMEFKVEESQSDMDAFIVSSPPQFCTACRTTDIDGLLHVLNSAEKFIYIEVMDYFPAQIYVNPNKYWPVIDDALRSAVFDRGVELRLMVGLMPHNLTRSDEYNYLESLAALDGSGRDHQVKAKVKFFIVPSYTPAQAKLLYARVNHAKFVVTDRHSYVSTSNWSGDYFVSTGGISMVLRNTNNCRVCDDLFSVFSRDWESSYRTPIFPWGN